jgi:transcriptional regulator GlxA family with amidase domain
MKEQVNRKFDVKKLHLMERLQNLMEQRKPYLNPKFSIIELTNMLGSNRTYVSVFLNEVLCKSFFDYVNEFRLVVAEKMVIETDDNFSEIATKSGFNSICTFRRAFIKKNGITPGKYRELYGTLKK